MNRLSVADIFEADASKLQREETERWKSLLASRMEALNQNPSDERARLAAAGALRKLQRHEEAVVLIAEGLSCTGASVALRHSHIEMLADCNRTNEAIAAAEEAVRLFPNDLLFQFQQALLLPVIYESMAEIGWYRCRVAEGLNRLCAGIRLDTLEEREAALTALGNHTNFYLGYQACNDRDLQVQYGELAHRIMAAGYPQWSAPLAMPATLAGEPLRIGYVSARFRDLSATRFFLGWLREHDPARFQVYTWHLGAKRDAVTDEVARVSHRFQHVTEFEKAAASIRACDPHVVVFLDIGLGPVMTQLAALRLAPVQCMAWDQPITSGLPTVDYAFSSDLAEPEGAEAHYSERLLRLPGVGVSYKKPAIPWPLLRKTRRDFGLRDGAVVYLCCQSAFKFLPENDDVFTRIARLVPDSQFVFIAPNPPVGDALRRRLGNAFRSEGLDAARHCLHLPQLRHLDYWNLHAVADIFLDTIGWSSGGSVFEAIACRIPVVTLPGDLMRGRQGFAILNQLGVTDTIARDKAEFVDIAVRLASEDSFRADVVTRMAQREGFLFSDARSVRALEEFFWTTCRGG